MVTKSESYPVVNASAVSLARYAQVMLVPECSFWGVQTTEDVDYYECFDIWMLKDRKKVAKYLMDAQREIEQQIGYLLSPKYIVGFLNDEAEGDSYYVDQRYSGLTVNMTRWKELIEPGIKAVTDLYLGETLEQGEDPAVWTTVYDGTTDLNEIHIFHADTDFEIDPSAIYIDGESLKVEIPRCRTVKIEFQNNSMVGVPYDDLEKFTTLIDVKRIYTDPSKQVTMRWAHKCNDYCASTGCAEHEQTGCMIIHDSKLGIAQVSAGEFVDDEWVGKPMCYSGHPMLHLYYLAGLKYLNEQAEDAIIRLAHSKMPDAPCGCDSVKSFWNRDKHVPDILTADRLNCPFGMNDGAWIAWNFALQMTYGSSSVF
jgi:hypothetical protein